MKNIGKIELLQKLATSFLITGLVVLFYFLIKTSIDGYSVWSNFSTNYEVTGQFGDFVGGVVGTFFAFAGTLLIFISLRLQVSDNEKRTFEATFFEMIRLYRENISELKYKKYKDHDFQILENRQVLSEIFREFNMCYREVKGFSNSQTVTDYISDEYAQTLKDLAVSNQIDINIIELALVDLSYSIVHYGIGEEGEAILRKRFRNQYNSDYLFPLLEYIKLKPKRSNGEQFRNWIKIRELDNEELKEFMKILYPNRRNVQYGGLLPEELKKFNIHQSYKKYYSGHQFRLGHYFRHLYQSYKFLSDQDFLLDQEKYNYGKLYRAQLSTYEQSLIFINSISRIGMKWQYKSELKSNRKPYNLITTYQMIKNIPGHQISGIKIKDYYPKVDFEGD